MSTRLAVLGSPIGHSRSPGLHAAAYRELGLEWEYSAIEVVEGSLDSFLSTLDDSWRGLSLTMPLKREVLPHLASRSALVQKTEVANTVLIERDEGGGLRLAGFNTDVSGVTGALGDHDIRSISTAHVLGAGATAASAVVASEHLGAERILVSARRPDAAADLAELAARSGIAVETRAFGDPLPFRAELLIDTLPGGAEPDDRPEVDDADTLVAVAYSPWPTARAARMQGAGAVVVDGLAMLLHQAIGQVRIFTTGSPYGELPNEEAVIGAMRSAVERS